MAKQYVCVELNERDFYEGVSEEILKDVYEQFDKEDYFENVKVSIMYKLKFKHNKNGGISFVPENITSFRKKVVNIFSGYKDINETSSDIMQGEMGVAVLKFCKSSKVIDEKKED